MKNIIGLVREKRRLQKEIASLRKETKKVEIGSPEFMLKTKQILAIEGQVLMFEGLIPPELEHIVNRIECDFEVSKAPFVVEPKGNFQKEPPNFDNTAQCEYEGKLPTSVNVNVMEKEFKTNELTPSKIKRRVRKSLGFWVVLVLSSFTLFACQSPTIQTSRENSAEGKKTGLSEMYFDGLNSPQKNKIVPKMGGQLLQNNTFEFPLPMRYWYMDMSEAGSTWSAQKIVFDTTAKATISEPTVLQTKKLYQPIILGIGIEYNLSIEIGIEDTYSTGLNNVVLRLFYDGGFQDFPLNTFVPAFQKIETSFFASISSNEIGFQIVSFENSGNVYVDRLELFEK